METKVCKCCGRELPIEKFRVTAMGRRNTCDECVQKKIVESKQKKKEEHQAIEEAKNARLLRLNDFTPRELMQELRRRGYIGKLYYTITQTIDLENLGE